jgi:hypothetical protein
MKIIRAGRESGDGDLPCQDLQRALPVPVGPGEGDRDSVSRDRIDEKRGQGEVRRPAAGNGAGDDGHDIGRLGRPFFFSILTGEGERLRMGEKGE